MRSDRNHYESNDENNYEDNYLDYEFSFIPYEELSRQIPPISPSPLPPFFPGNTPSPGPGNFGMPQGGPPNYIPSKNDKGVQKLSSDGKDLSTKAVSPGSISFCLFKFTYIWESNGRSYWAYLINVDRRSVSGFRWMGRFWAYFGVDLRRIDSFVCYRSDDSCDCNNSIFDRSSDVEYESTKKEYSLSDVREIYSKTLAYIDIPETKDDYLVETIGVVDGNSVQSKIPCKKTRLTSYRIVLEVSYPEDLDENIKDNINDIVDDCSKAAIDLLSMPREKSKKLNPLESFNNALTLIPTALKAVSNRFSVCIKKIPGYAEISNYIKFTIRKEKNSDRWRIL